MAKTNQAGGVAVHLSPGFDPDAGVWRTACGLELDKAARAAAVLADDRREATCKACKETAE